MYLKGWFIIDLIASMPLEQFFGALATQGTDSKSQLQVLPLFDTRSSSSSSGSSSGGSSGSRTYSNR